MPSDNCKHVLPDRTARLIAVLAGCDPHTVQRYAAGRPVRPAGLKLVEVALERLDLQVLRMRRSDNIERRKHGVDPE